MLLKSVDSSAIIGSWQSVSYIRLVICPVHGTVFIDCNLQLTKVLLIYLVRQVTL